MSLPLDTFTLITLRGACQINPDTGHTHLMDFCDMGAVEQSRTEIESDGAPVFLVEHVPGSEPLSPTEIIVDLVDEILRLRGES